MKEKIFDFLNTKYWLSEMDKETVEKFLIDFFDQYQPERLSEKTSKEDAIV